MIKVDSLIGTLKKKNINFFTGVPDSVLKALSSKLQNFSKKKHIIAVNEGSAISLGIGYYLSTKKVPCIYMQNSGLSNALNPLISIAHKKVYEIPLVLLIGWRGSPRLKDEPQHNVKGKITENILKLLKIKYSILRSASDLNKFENQIKLAKKNKSIVAALIEQGTLVYKNKNKKIANYNDLDKEFFFEELLKILDKKTKIISSTGFNSRELMYIRNKLNLSNENDFYMVGGMGHTSSVALGYSLFNKKKTICIDGDGSLLMHLGSIKTIGTFSNKNLKYILLNNHCHDSVGGQKTFSEDIDFKQLSRSLGFVNFYLIKNKQGFKKKIKNFLNDKSKSFLEVKISNSRIKNLPRPINLINIKNQFMK